MLNEKPHLEFVGSQHLTDEKIVRTVVAQFGGTPRCHPNQGNDRLVCVDQTRELYGHLPPTRWRA